MCNFWVNVGDMSFKEASILTVGVCFTLKEVV